MIHVWFLLEILLAWGPNHAVKQNRKSFYKGLYVTFKLASDLKKNTVYMYLSSYSPLNGGHVSILSNAMLRTYTSDIMLYSVQLKSMYSYLNSSLKLSDIVRGLSCQQSYCG